MIVVRKTFTADNADALAATDLDPIPYDGLLLIYVGSTVQDTEVSVSGAGGITAIRAQIVAKRTDGEPSLQNDTPIFIPVTAGQKAVVNINIVSAGTCVLIAMLTP